MLHSLHGTLMEFEDDYAVVDTGGIRFAVEIPGSTAQLLPGAGEQTTLLTRLSFNPNEGSFQLFGFGTEMERDCFDVLCTISGIGPRKALAILSQIEVGAFAHAIVTQDLTYVSKIKGVGKKTAERLIVELREKMVPFAQKAPEAAVTFAKDHENVADAIQGMIALGCKPVVAEKAIRAAVEELGEDAKTEDLLKEGLKWR